MPSYKIAVTSTDGRKVNQHFGQAALFHIWELEEGQGTPKEIETRQVKGAEEATCQGKGQQGCGHDDEQLKKLAEALADCSYLLTEKIGKRPCVILNRYGLQVLECNVDIEYAIQRLTRYLSKKQLKKTTSLSG
ncbi:MAG: hypothetical protein LBT22_09050 [Peptococcaceae bacterium]|jgi:predicted Fe-Mo cluster-binding NifX family protein|nr:hypothetical protein [Peptococcaceae bacterium]